MLMLCYSDSVQNDDKAIMVINCLMNITGNIHHTFSKKIMINTMSFSKKVKLIEKF